MGKKSVEANSSNKQCENDTIVIERFSKKRYETYKAKGIPFKIVCGSGRLCEVKAFDCGVNNDQALVESLCKFLGKDDVSTFYANQKNGSTQFSGGKLSIYRGPWFKRNDLVVKTIDGCVGRTIFFWHGINPKDNMLFAHWEAYSPYDDFHDSEFRPCTTGSDLKSNLPGGGKGNYHFRLATAKDFIDYRKALRDHRITWEDDGRFYHYPHVGDHYYEIFFNHGVADFRECVLESYDTRPEISRLIMKCDLDVHLELREKRVRKRVDGINKALGLKE